jgi:hypothetical protein
LDEHFLAGGKEWCVDNDGSDLPLRREIVVGSTDEPNGVPPVIHASTVVAGLQEQSVIHGDCGSDVPEFVHAEGRGPLHGVLASEASE